MNFWEKMVQSNKFDDLFDKEDLKLEEVLENEEIILEFRNRNPRLLN